MNPRDKLERVPAAWSVREPEHDHLAVLVLAWAYILSARWTEIIPGAHGMRYTTHSCSFHSPKPPPVVFSVTKSAGWPTSHVRSIRLAFRCPPGSPLARRLSRTLSPRGVRRPWPPVPELGVGLHAERTRRAYRLSTIWCGPSTYLASSVSRRRTSPRRGAL